MRKSRTARDVWYAMVRRCTDPTDKAYSFYGARGITVAPEWLDFERFAADMGARPIGLQLDRIDNNSGYCKANCRWVTPVENGNNKRNNVRLTARGVTLSVSEWARRTGISRSTLFSRHYRGWPAERVVA
jgi:hypothetical protein